ncbi:ABC protein [Melanogaster broomeanus]|nr:ABC protein [Melanogaster broomeanus]
MPQAHSSESEKAYSIADPKNEPAVTVQQPFSLQLDTGNEYLRFRQKWWQLWLPKDLPALVPASLEDAKITPLATTSILSEFTYTWITDIMVIFPSYFTYYPKLMVLCLGKQVLGYQRTLQASDLYKMDPSREAGRLSEKLEAAWARRVAAAVDWNDRLEKGEIDPSFLTRLSFVFRAMLASQGKEGCTYAERRGALEKHWREVEGRKEASLTWALNDVIGDTSQLMGPIVLKSLITLAEERAAARATGEPAPSVGRGVGMALGLFLLTVTTSVCTHQVQFFWRSMATGVLARAALIASIYERGVSLTGKARVKLTNATLVNHISSDVSRIDACAQYFHAAWTAPIQVIICLIILIVQLGPSALAGFALFVLVIPIQERVMSFQHRHRLHSMVWTDQRANVLLEVLSTMRVVKYFSYESSFLQKISELRKKELRGIRKILHSSSANHVLPVLAATLSFVAYTLTAHSFNVAVIFSSLSLFNLLRQPMMLMPRALSAIPDAASALQRLSHDAALIVKDATFEWETSEKVGQTIPEIGGGKGRGQGRGGWTASRGTTTKGIEVKEAKEVTIFKLGMGQLTAIVGPVGSGKSSLLQGLIGEMRKVSGHVSFGGRVAYCPQTAWIQNASLIGEKGINLSGGQKQRVNIARALYADPDIVVFDDPLSAVDAHVGKALFEQAIIGTLRNRGVTVVLVTHAIHFLPQVDYIYTMNNGGITESGTYTELYRERREYGGHNKDEEKPEQEVEQAVAEKQGVTVEDAKLKSANGAREGYGRGKTEGHLIVKEQRTTGSVSLGVAARGAVTVPLRYAFHGRDAGKLHHEFVCPRLVGIKPSNVHVPPVSRSLLTIPEIIRDNAGVIVAPSRTSWHILSRKICITRPSRKVFYAPMSFFDTTPMGRILSVFGKDIDSVDNQLALSVRLLVLILGNVFGAVIISLLSVVILMGYSYFAAFYRASAREVKRLGYGADSMLRSMYATFRTLTGLADYQELWSDEALCEPQSGRYIDLEDRSLYLVITNQRWLAIRLDFMGAMLVFLVAMLAATDVSGINAAQIGLVLTYTTSLVPMCSLGDNRRLQNSRKRYTLDTTIPQEAPHEIESSKPPADWPSHGALEFNDVKMSYRPGLPLVLNGISLSVKGGEKIGVVGRTGAGKSSLMLALYRIVELSGGSILLDGTFAPRYPLFLRTSIMLVIAKPLLFSGTIRSNLDPFNRSCLVDTPSDKEEVMSGEEIPQNRYNLDSVVESEGANLSVGERSLLSLARALVKDCKVVVLDEATASVDLETDSKIQRTIQTEFSDCTLLCIAHRLRTIVSYDRILVLDAGRVAEFDTPYNLYQSEQGLFRGMCERSNISLTDIEVGKRDTFGSLEA